ncbi:MAG: PH domain-containing protein [Patulibacter sp.]|nr:PH domain-containing protein [Patulibacter sp.]
MSDVEPATGRADEISSPSPARRPADEPTADVVHEQLSPRAVGYWRASLTLRLLPLAVVVTVAALLLSSLPGGLRAAAAIVAWGGGLLAIVVVPPIRHRIWWFAIGDEEVDLHHGLLTITRTVVPMVRVQHVDLHRGPLAERFRLAEIELHTAAGSLTIPALDQEQAERIRRQVAVLARVPDDV